ncbi:hypothetical protein B7R54_01710 [Subtercola boreus]|uniref:Abortive infection protein-like C-terminal domain-containing protein n=2 Tax=Subtercola boreus TaxID=120213 RepID=A0A3E0VEA5_9MICO|nr:hypothetical protein B7R54_01710 [Subtercola boreus]
MYDGAKFRDAADDILLNHRVEWAFTPGGLVSRGNQELHAEIVKPATELLAADAKYLKVKNAYNKALLELSNGDPGDAITDASSALQEMFRTLGVEGKSASEQAKKALNQGLLKGYDAKLIDTVVRASEWVSAERNNNGDAHKDGSSSLKEDAWLIIHIAGALILRLSGQALRSPQNDQRPAGGGEPVQEGDSF